MTSSNKSGSINEREYNKVWDEFYDFCEKSPHCKVEVDVKEGQPVGCRLVVRDGLLQRYFKFD